jgi:hypothetical protein
MKPGLFTYAVVAMAAAHIAFALAGLAINPDFSVGDDATAVQVLGVDYNGWHAVAGLSLFVPALLLLRWPQYTRTYVYAIAAVVLATAVWGLLDEHPIGLLFLPDSRADAIFHFLSALGFLILLPLDKRVPATVDA